VRYIGLGLYSAWRQSARNPEWWKSALNMLGPTPYAMTTDLRKRCFLKLIPWTRSMVMYALEMAMYWWNCIQGIACMRRRRRAANNLWAPPPTFVDQRAAAAADNLFPRRRCHFCCVFILLQFSIFDDFKMSSENFEDRTKYFRESLEKTFQRWLLGSAARRNNDVGAKMCDVTHDRLINRFSISDAHAHWVGS